MAFEFRSKAQLRALLKQSRRRGHISSEAVEDFIKQFDLPDAAGPREGKVRRKLGGLRANPLKGRTR